MTAPLARIAANAAWLAVGEVILKGALFVAAALVARGMGAAGMGVFTVAYGAALVLTQLLAAGQVEVVIREVAAGTASGPSLFAAARRVQRRVAAVLVPLALFASCVAGGPYRLALLAFVPYAYLRARLITGTAVFKGLDRMAVEVWCRGVEVAVALLGLAAAVTLRLPAWTAGLAFALGGMAGAALAAGKVATLGEAQVATAARVLWRHGLPFVGLAAVSQVQARADVFVLAGLGVTAEAVGHYGAAATPIWGLVAVAQLVAVAIYPTLSRAAVAGALGVRHALLLAGGGAGLGAALAAALAALRRPLVAVVFGRAFDPAAELLAVLAWALPGACVAMVLGVMVAALRRQGWTLLAHGGVVVSAVVAYAVVVPRWGVRGCAVAAMAASVALGLALLTSAVAAARWPGRTAPLTAPTEAQG